MQTLLNAKATDGTAARSAASAMPSGLLISVVLLISPFMGAAMERAR